MLLFSLDTDASFSQELAALLGVALAPLENRSFEDGEHKLRPLTDPFGENAYVVHSLYGEPDHSPHDKLCQLLMFAATLRDHGVQRVTAVVPYLAYARKDRQTKPFDPLNLRYVAQLLEVVGLFQIMVLEVHNLAAFQNAFRCKTLHLQGHHAFDAQVAGWAADDPLIVASPDPGGVKRAQLWREWLEQTLQRPVGFALVDKRRSAGLVSSEHLVSGEVANSTVFLLDDIIASGQTMQLAARALLGSGARKVFAFAAHGLFTGDAAAALADDSIAKISVTNSVPSFRLPASAGVNRKLTTISAAPLFARAILASQTAAWR